MLVLAAAVALRLRGLRSFGLWQDELISWEMTSNGLHHYLDVFRHVDANQPLHVIALLAWGTKGKSEAWIRLPSVVEGIAPAMIRYSQDARGYALVALLVRRPAVG